LGDKNCIINFGKLPLERRRKRWEDKIKMDLRVTGRGDGRWMEVVQDPKRGLQFTTAEH
jgi:hypothetical protein